MSPEEPHPLAWLLELIVQVSHQGNRRSRAAVGRDNRGTVGAAQRIVRVVTHCSGEKASVEIEQI
jgi:hypothetical protein